MVFKSGISNFCDRISHNGITRSYKQAFKDFNQLENMKKALKSNNYQGFMLLKVTLI